MNETKPQPRAAARLLGVEGDGANAATVAKPTGTSDPAAGSATAGGAPICGTDGASGLYQLDPTQNDYGDYTLSFLDDGGGIIGSPLTVLAVHNTKTYGERTYLANTEYWPQVDPPSGTMHVKFSGTGKSWPSTDPAPGTTPIVLCDLGWKKDPIGPLSGETWFYDVSATPQAGLCFTNERAKWVIYAGAVPASGTHVVTAGIPRTFGGPNVPTGTRYIPSA